MQLPTTPHPWYIAITGSVWLVLISLAVTHRISVDFFSSGYLDVSVPRVAPSLNVSKWEVPFGNPRFKGCMPLPWAYRSLPRPSSLHKPSHPHNRSTWDKQPSHQPSSEILKRISSALRLKDWLWDCTPKWTRRDLNPWPPPCKGGALPGWATGPLNLRPPFQAAYIKWTRANL